ncbi:MAG: caspase family protein, partial [Anaerolineae bacterium]
MNRDSASTADADACRSQFARSLAVVIGIGDYTSGIPTLTTPVNDATYLARSLAREHGYEVRLLVTEVIKAKLETKLSEELARELGPDDRLLVYFAGHGVALDGDDGPAGYLLPQDANPDDRSTFLAMTELHGWLNNLPCRHLLLILDCCFAGAFRWASTRHIGVLPDVIHKERFDRFLQSPAWQVITSASYDQRALDVLTGSVVSCLGTRKEHSDRHSPFAQAFFAGLAGEGDIVPKGQGDGVITASELALYLRQIVEVEVAQRATLEQTPQIWPLSKHRTGEYIFLVPGHPLNLPPAETLTARNNPYRGLRPYEREHQELFFGREEETEELLARIESQPFVAVLGASGTGKSSLVKAGLLPRLADAGPGWCVLPPMRPTDHPVQALSSLLRENLSGVPVKLDAVNGLAQATAGWKSMNPKARLVLTVDQCEELITLCRDDARRAHFSALLAEAVRSQPDAFRLVLTLRSDFEPQLAQETPLESGWLAARYVVPPMDQSDLRDVIEGPASVRVLYFEPPELVDKLINEVVQMPGALPLLSFTLSEMYLRYVRSGRDNRALTQGDYQALGGVIGSLRQRASEEHDALPDDAHRATM